MNSVNVFTPTASLRFMNPGPTNWEPMNQPEWDTLCEGPMALATMTVLVGTQLKHGDLVQLMGTRMASEASSIIVISDIPMYSPTFPYDISDI